MRWLIHHFEDSHHFPLGFQQLQIFFFVWERQFRISPTQLTLNLKWLHLEGSKKKRKRKLNSLLQVDVGKKNHFLKVVSVVFIVLFWAVLYVRIWQLEWLRIIVDNQHDSFDSVRLVWMISVSAISPTLSPVGVRASRNSFKILVWARVIAAFSALLGSSACACLIYRQGIHQLDILQQEMIIGVISFRRSLERKSCQVTRFSVHYARVARLCT